MSPGRGTTVLCRLKVTARTHVPHLGLQLPPQASVFSPVLVLISTAHVTPSVRVTSQPPHLGRPSAAGKVSAHTVLPEAPQVRAGTALWFNRPEPGSVWGSRSLVLRLARHGVPPFLRWTVFVTATPGRPSVFAPLSGRARGSSGGSRFIQPRPQHLIRHQCSQICIYKTPICHYFHKKLTSASKSFSISTK